MPCGLERRALRFIDIIPDFAQHLSRLGVDLGKSGQFHVDEAAWFETPLPLYRCNICDAPAEIGAFI
ncbi:hypothetical protein [uncultured Sphingomonas sp.]|uniref:hypothetical protein n=1 Tax=uncultured Sphingomonas sp. TaxID=158754 RepID=UPI0025CBFF36|nr:hypothetical protein [uncultured Sphingomonas sp.]